MDTMKDAKELLEIQGRDGNWNHDDYMLGMYNGMECVIATIEHREPLYRNGPIKTPNTDSNLTPPSESQK